MAGPETPTSKINIKFNKGFNNSINIFAQKQQNWKIEIFNFFKPFNINIFLIKNIDPIQYRMLREGFFAEIPESGAKSKEFRTTSGTRLWKTTNEDTDGCLSWKGLVSLQTRHGWNLILTLVVSHGLPS